MVAIGNVSHWTLITFNSACQHVGSRQAKKGRQNSTQALCKGSRLQTVHCSAMTRPCGSYHGIVLLEDLHVVDQFVLLLGHTLMMHAVKISLLPELVPCS